MIRHLAKIPNEIDPRKPIDVTILSSVTVFCGRYTLHTEDGTSFVWGRMDECGWAQCREASVDLPAVTIATMKLAAAQAVTP